MESPEQAAAVAAWQALTTPYPAAPGAPLRHYVHYAGDLASPAPPDRLANLLGRQRAAAKIDVRRGVEPGQGSFWVLLATPCGTVTEDATNAGTLAVML